MLEDSHLAILPCQSLEESGNSIVMKNDKKNTYIAILRGINVSGKNMVKMPALVKAFESIGFENVRSYVQSGNVVFQSEPIGPERLQRLISEQIEKDLGLSVPLLVLEEIYLKQVIENNPFVKRQDIDLAKLHVTFLAQEPDQEKISKIDSDKYNPDEFIFDKKVIYLNCPGGYGKTKLHNNFFEGKLKVDATTRNWKTVNALVELANN